MLRRMLTPYPDNAIRIAFTSNILQSSSVITCVVINEEYNSTVNGEKLIGTTEYLTL
jgi:hypothetical protein